jgi:hypothetical protein
LGGGDFVIPQGESLAQAVGRIRVVFDDEHTPSSAGHARTSFCSGTSAKGETVTYGCPVSMRVTRLYRLSAT